MYDLNRISSNFLNRLVCKACGHWMQLFSTGESVILWTLAVFPSKLPAAPEMKYVVSFLTKPTDSFLDFSLPFLFF